MRVLNAEIHFLSNRKAMLAVLLLVVAGFAHAQTDDSQPAVGDPPARVARISYAAGDLGLMPAGSTQWSAADINRPLTNGDKLSTGADAKAELELGGTTLRIDGQSDIGVLNLDGQTGQFELTQGTANITVRAIYDNATYEIDTPTLALVISQPGSFRVDVGSDGSSTSVTVFDGSAMVYGENNAQHDVYSGRSYRFMDSALANVMVSDIGGGDAFDAWCNERNSETNNDETATAQYVSDDMVGASDLDTYGNWQDDGDYGYVWYPGNVGAGWAPYRFGHWVWIAPWGWTWVDNLPWGFAPYHYGRWAFVRGRWGWLPGSPRTRPVYAPALVAFVGMGGGGPVGWFPLGPHDIYNPWYHASFGYYTRLNVAGIGVHPGFTRGMLLSNVSHQYNFYQSGRAAPGVVYANRSVPQAYTAVSAAAFAGARNVQANQVRLNSQQLAAAVANPAALQRPTSASFGPPRVVNARQLPAAGFNRQVVAVNRPSPAVSANASFRAGQPSSNVHVLGVSRSAIASSPRVITGENDARPEATPRPVENNERPAILPQVPHFEQAERVQSPPTPNYPPPEREQSLQEREQPAQQAEQNRFESAEQSHQYVPEQRQEPNSYQAYRPEAHSQQVEQPYRAPEQAPRPEPQQQSHAQSESRSAPPARSSEQNQH